MKDFAVEINSKHWQLACWAKKARLIACGIYQHLTRAQKRELNHLLRDAICIQIHKELGLPYILKQASYELALDEFVQSLG